MDDHHGWVSAAHVDNRRDPFRDRGALGRAAQPRFGKISGYARPADHQVLDVDDAVKVEHGGDPQLPGREIPGRPSTPPVPRALAI